MLTYNLVSLNIINRLRGNFTFKLVKCGLIIDCIIITFNVGGLFGYSAL